MGCFKTCFCDLLTGMVLVCNFIFFFLGCAFIAVGIYLYTSGIKDYFDIICGGAYVNSAVCFIGLGSIIALVAFFGCCGAMTQSACMMYTFGTFMSLILLAEIGVAIGIFFFKQEVYSFIAGKAKDGERRGKKKI